VLREEFLSAEVPFNADCISVATVPVRTRIIRSSSLFLMIRPKASEFSSGERGKSTEKGDLVSHDSS